jgi:PAS domain S-box-containing protein
MGDEDIDNLRDDAPRPRRGGPENIAAERRRGPLKQHNQSPSEITHLSQAVDAPCEHCALLQALIDAAPDYLWVKDINGAFVVANTALAANYGRTNASEMIGLSDFDIHEREQAQGFYDLEQDILRSGQPMIDREESVVGSSGAKTWLVSTKAPLRNDRNETCGLVGVARDITELSACRCKP